MSRTSDDFCTILKEWRGRRRFSQLALAAEAQISQRHLSFLESGRSRPSREMVGHLAETLDMPLEIRNGLFAAAGFAPAYGGHDLEAPEMATALAAIDRIIESQMPFPAVVVDRYWTLLRANPAALAFLDGVAPHLVGQAPNVLRLSLHPEGLAPRILNLAEWRAHVLARLRHEVDVTADFRLAALREELAAMPCPGGSVAPPRPGELAIPLRIRTDAGVLSLISTTTVFGSAVDVTLSNVTIESFFPADDETRRLLMG